MGYRSQQNLLDEYNAWVEGMTDALGDGDFTPIDQLDQYDMMRVYYAAYDIRTQCQDWPLPWFSPDQAPPTAQYGTAGEQFVKMNNEINRSRNSA